MSAALTDQIRLPEITVTDAVRIGTFATQILSSEATIQRARAAMKAGSAMVLPSAIDSEFLEGIWRHCRQATFCEEHIESIGWRLIEEQDRAGKMLRFALQRPGFLRWIEEAAGCGPLSTITGVVARTMPGTEQGLDWHDDLNAGAGRRLALTLHLNEAPFEGGLFEIRRKADDLLLVRQAMLEPGSITIFRIDKHYRHRVTPVTGGSPRQVFAGWLNA